MFKLDNNFLTSLGLGGLPVDEKNKLLQHIYERLELNVGMRLAEKMTDAQLNEFEGFIDRNDEQGALRWLETNFPNYKDVVAEELEKLKQEVSQAAPQIIAAAQAQASQPPVQPAAPTQFAPQQFAPGPSSAPSAPQPDPAFAPQPQYGPPAPQPDFQPYQPPAPQPYQPPQQDMSTFSGAPQPAQSYVPPTPMAQPDPTFTPVQQAPAQPGSFQPPLPNQGAQPPYNQPPFPPSQPPAGFAPPQDLQSNQPNGL